MVRGWLGSAMVFCLVLLAGPAPRAESTDPATLLAGVTDRLVQEASRHGQEYRRDPDRARALARELLAPLSADERAQVASGTARRVYRLA